MSDQKVNLAEIFHADRAVNQLVLGVREVYGPGLRRCVSSDVRLDRRYGRKPTLEDQDAHQRPALGRFQAARVEFRRKKAI